MKGMKKENRLYPEQFVDLYQQNLKVQSEKMAETILEQAISQLSPTMQKVLAGEFKGVNISDLLKNYLIIRRLKITRKSYSRGEKRKS